MDGAEGGMKENPDCECELHERIKKMRKALERIAEDDIYKDSRASLVEIARKALK